MNEKLLTGIAIGIGVALLLQHNKGGNGGTQPPIKTLPGKTLPPAPKSALMGYSRRYPRVGYPVYLGF